MKPLYIVGTDHAGLILKNFVVEFLASRKFEVMEFVPKEGMRVDYPDYAAKVCEAIEQKQSEGRECYGILICGSGIGMSIAANRFRHIRAALCLDAYMAKMARLHNDANVLCMGERISGVGEVESILETFVNTEFEGGRHLARIQKL